MEYFSVDQLISTVNVFYIKWGCGSVEQVYNYVIHWTKATRRSLDQKWWTSLICDISIPRNEPKIPAAFWSHLNKSTKWAVFLSGVHKKLKCKPNFYSGLRIKRFDCRDKSCHGSGCSHAVSGQCEMRRKKNRSALTVCRKHAKLKFRKYCWDVFFYCKW